MSKKTPYQLEMHEQMVFKSKDPDPDHSWRWIVTKVPGGWIYADGFQGHLVFVPDDRKSRKPNLGPG